ncbi:hypothetical protein G7Y89_g11007 [Cudoniella acicularis]|uniref:Uncharacterized protein n=1 Tax=Cudoniella acicularis TaxID=354080 RepID=A0A8H4W0F1_9HELO|nr:hypothetical protein G7Y89_g11007 [Cudoniella acicularis]
MMAHLVRLLDVKSLKGIEEFKTRGPELFYSLFHAYFRSFGMNSAMKGGQLPSEIQVPHITRQGLFHWLLMYMCTFPDEMHLKLNAILARKDHLFLDPFTNEAWKFPRIPRSAFPETPIADKVKQVEGYKKAWKTERNKVLDDFKADAEAAKKRNESQSRSERNPGNSGGGAQAAAMSVASADLAAARMRASALSNTSSVYRPPGTSRGYSYQPEPVEPITELDDIIFSHRTTYNWAANSIQRILMVASSSVFGTSGSSIAKEPRSRFSKAYERMNSLAQVDSLITCFGVNVTWNLFNFDGEFETTMSNGITVTQRKLRDFADQCNGLHCYTPLIENTRFNTNPETNRMPEYSFTEDLLNLAFQNITISARYALPHWNTTTTALITE